MENISIKEGGLGIQNPRTNAINTYMTTSKRCLQYTQEGVWLGFNENGREFPPAIKFLYEDWDRSHNRSWVIFRNYLDTFIMFQYINQSHQPITSLRLHSMAPERK
jgi:hypothetical protein